MTISVSLSSVAGGLEEVDYESHVYLNRATGELVTIRDEEIQMVEQGRLPDDLPDWQQDMVQMTAEVLASKEYLELPTKFEIDEYTIMERFCMSADSDWLADELLGKIRGSGAFRRFKDTIIRHGIADQWYAYRQRAFEEIAVGWLEENGIAYVRA